MVINIKSIKDITKGWEVQMSKRVVIKIRNMKMLKHIFLVPQQPILLLQSKNKKQINITKGLVFVNLYMKKPN